MFSRHHGLPLKGDLTELTFSHSIGVEPWNVLYVSCMVSDKLPYY